MTDVALSLFAIGLFSPIWLAIVFAIISDDGFPVLYFQTRLGKKRRSFNLIKFRSMRNESTTCVGRWLRQTGLDETLQFYNVIKGEMSLVGPRPLTAYDIERLGWGKDNGYERWSLRPGITGLAQLYSGRGKRVSSFLERYYLQHHSFCLDLKVIFLSLMVNIFGKKRIQKLLRRKKITGLAIC